MKTQDFPNCCGIELLSQFGNTYTTIDTTPYTKEQVADYIINNRKIDYGLNRLQMIILNDDQINKLTKQLFIDLNFKIIELGRYPGHGSDLYMLIYNPNEPLKHDV